MIACQQRADRLCSQEPGEAAWQLCVTLGEAVKKNGEGTSLAVQWLRL